MKRLDPKLSPDELRERAFRYLVKSRQYAERAELYYRTADRRERAVDDKMTAKWPWPCPGKDCAAIFTTAQELEQHAATTGHKPPRGGPRP